MRTLAKILLPVDFSERSVGAARYAKTLARHFHSEITLLHVLTPPHYEFGALEVGGTMFSDLYSTRAAQVEKDLEAFLAADLEGCQARRLVLEGDPAQRIIEHAHSGGFDLIVMPTHGYGTFRRFILGSITAKVLHDADCPVWTGVHIQEAPPEESISLRHILCAIDLGPQTCKTLEWAGGLGAAFGTRMTVIHATTCLNEDTTPKDLENTAREEIQKLEKSAGVRAELVLEPGDPPKVVCAAAERLRADVLVIGRGSAGGVFGRLRTNAYAIIRQSPCPVVSV